MRSAVSSLFVLGILFAIPAFANAGFIEEDFETLNLGGLAGQGAWDDYPGLDAQVITSVDCYQGIQCMSASSTGPTAVLQQFASSTIQTQELYFMPRGVDAETFWTPGAPWRVHHNSSNNLFSFSDYGCFLANADLFGAEFPKDRWYRIRFDWRQDAETLAIQVKDLTTLAQYQDTFVCDSTPLDAGGFEIDVVGASTNLFDSYGDNPGFDVPGIAVDEENIITAIDITNRIDAGGGNVDVYYDIHYSNPGDIYLELKLDFYNDDLNVLSHSATSSAGSGDIIYSASTTLAASTSWQLYAGLANPVSATYPYYGVQLRRSFTTDLSITITMTDSGFEPCGFSSIQGCLTNAGAWLFRPSSRTINDLLDKTNTLRTRFPFAYASEMGEIIATSLGADEHFVISASSTDPDADLVIFNTQDIVNSSILPFDFFRTLMKYSVYGFFGLWAYRKAVDFRMKDV